ncbi:enolase-phosphatase E1 isoform X1 [Drosophila guanche]|uniref:Enolase-phosphatase E1 n=1 Tax=Drosophila guanche TaxID=7266 RepID=A0A3B0KHP3_DROGU|nr:enolase-phosphatase E1 isoform X1 [Drosophila guanche]SPP84621.1 blast:Enolase-phosphatase E1 [Drosophila guanche]
MPSTDRVANVVLVDIEGTTTSISFVHDVLFPYAKNNVKKFLADGWESSSEIKQIVQELQQVPQYAEYTSTLRVPPTEVDVQIITGFVRYLIDKDLKVTPLKTLQGLIWQQGYETGELRGHVFDDVPGAFAAWRGAGLRIAVYSSGSVAAQKLIFKYSIAGDLLTHLSAHFDTHVGHKQETQSYVNIAKSLGEDPRNILFLTDIPGEAAAARAAGLQAIMLQRPGNAPLTDDQKSGQELIADFSSLHSLQLPE